MSRFLGILFLIVSCQTHSPIDEKVVEIKKDKSRRAIDDIDVYIPKNKKIEESKNVTIIELSTPQSKASTTNISTNKNASEKQLNDEDSNQTKPKEDQEQTISVEKDMPNDNSQQSETETTQSEKLSDNSQENIQTQNIPNDNSKQSETETTRSEKSSDNSQDNIPKQIYNSDNECEKAPFFVEIIDDNFKAELRILIPDAFSEDNKLDVNHCSVINLERLDIRSKSISNILEIKYFLKLNVLKCDSNNLKTLDISKNIELIEIRCSNNQLSRLDVSKNINLKTLYAFSNDIENLDLSNNTKLIKISIRRNRITEFDLRGIYTLSSRAITLNAYDGSKNKIRIIRVQESLKNHSELIEAKTRGGDQVVIITYDSSGKVVCSDWNSMTSNCQ